MLKNGFSWILIVVTVAALLGGGFFIYKNNKKPVSEDDLNMESGGFRSPLAGDEGTDDIFALLNDIGKEEEIETGINADENIHVLLLGIDRRSRAEAYRTDIMILATLNPTENKIVLASVPRDLWWDGGRINAVFYNNGWGEMQTAFEKVTGIKPDHYILTDFADFSWVVDAMGGVPVDVQISFTDSSYPVDATKGYQTVTFTQGYEKMTGERALIFARSRKGDNDNGDWGRMKRQHLLLKGMLEAVVQEGSLFNPMVVEKAFNMVTTNKMDTNLTVNDAKFLWDFHKERDKYTIESIYMDYDYLHTPPAENYGGAWVLVAPGEDYTQFRSDLDVAIHPSKQPTEIEQKIEEPQVQETPTN